MSSSPSLHTLIAPASLPQPVESPTTESKAGKSKLKKKVDTFLKRVGYAVELAAPHVLPILANRKPIGEVKSGDRTVRYYKHWPSDATLLAEWDALSRSVAGATVFQSPAWQRAVAISSDALGTLRLITVHHKDRLVAVVPLERKWGGLWRTAGALTTAYHDPLVHPEAATETWRTILAAAAKFRMKSLAFQLLSPNAECVADIPTAAADTGFNALDEVATMQTEIELAATWDEYLAKLGSHDRKELRRKMKKAEEKGGAKFVVNESVADVQAALPSLFTFMERGGGMKANKARLLYGRHFAQAAAPLAASGRLVIYQLFCENRLAAALLALPQNNRQLLWGCGLDSDLQQWSPGIVLFGMAFRRAIEQGQTSIDLLRGTFSYKYSLGAVDHAMHRLTLTRSR